MQYLYKTFYIIQFAQNHFFKATYTSIITSTNIITAITAMAVMTITIIKKATMAL